MKKLFFLIVTGILAFQMSVSAQDDNRAKKDLYMHKIASFSNMKGWGIGLTVGGSILTIVGISKASSTLANDPNLANETAAAKYSLGIMTASIGLTMVGGGIVLWSIGGSKKRMYINKLNSLSLNLNPNINQTFSFAYRF